MGRKGCEARDGEVDGDGPGVALDPGATNPLPLQMGMNLGSL
jgi:hypothetical protein